MVKFKTVFKYFGTLTLKICLAVGVAIYYKNQHLFGAVGIQNLIIRKPESFENRAF